MASDPNSAIAQCGYPVLFLASYLTGLGSSANQQMRDLSKKWFASCLGSDMRHSRERPCCEGQGKTRIFRQRPTGFLESDHSDLFERWERCSLCSSASSWIPVSSKWTGRAEEGEESDAASLSSVERTDLMNVVVGKNSCFICGYSSWWSMESSFTTNFAGHTRKDRMRVSRSIPAPISHDHQGNSKNYVQNQIFPTESSLPSRIKSFKREQVFQSKNIQWKQPGRKIRRPGSHTCIGHSKEWPLLKYGIKCRRYDRMSLVFGITRYILIIQ